MNFKVAIIPVPYEKTTSYGKGAKYGPAAIISALDYVEDYDIEEDKIIKKAPINILPALKNIDTFQILSEKINKITNKVLIGNNLPVYLGGEHTITIAAIFAIKKHCRDFTVLHFDAHSDMRDVYPVRADRNGVNSRTKYSHACVMRRVWEMRTPIVSVGIRSQSYEEHRFIIGVGAKHAWPLHIFYAHEIHKDRDWIKKIISKLGRNIYITFDVDVFDPSCLSATGTPEPGGLYWQQVVDFFKVLSKSKKQIVGMDMVELAPQKGNNASDFLCAKLILKILAFFSAQC